MYVPMLICEPKMSVADVHYDAARVIVHDRFLVWSVVDIEDLHVCVFKSQPVVFRFNLGGILRKTGIDAEQTHSDRQAQKLAMHTRPLDRFVSATLSRAQRYFAPASPVNRSLRRWKLIYLTNGAAPRSGSACEDDRRTGRNPSTWPGLGAQRNHANAGGVLPLTHMGMHILSVDETLSRRPVVSNGCCFA